MKDWINAKLIYIKNNENNENNVPYRLSPKWLCGIEYIYIYNKFQNQKDLQNKSVDWFLYDGNFDV